VPVSFDLVSTMVGFGLVIVAGARFGAGSTLALRGLFPAQGRSDWPQGIQEGDVPRFVLDPAPALRSTDRGEVQSILELDPFQASTPTLEPIEPHVRHLAAHR
jgi:hypothetical protein